MCHWFASFIKLYMCQKLPFTQVVLRKGSNHKDLIGGGGIFSFFLVILVLSVLCLKVGPSSSKRKCVIFFIESTLKMMKNRFLFHLESSFKFSRYLRFCHDFLVYKNKVNFKIHDVTSWLRSTCSRHIAQYRTK